MSTFMRGLVSTLALTLFMTAPALAQCGGCDDATKPAKGGEGEKKVQKAKDDCGGCEGEAKVQKAKDDCGGCEGEAKTAKVDKSQVGACVEIPVTSATAGCCKSSISKELAKVDGVMGVDWKNKGEVLYAVLCVRKGKTAKLSALQKALERATAGMGKAMGLTYTIDAKAFGLRGAVLCLESKDEGTVKAALSKLKGTKAVSTKSCASGTVCAVPSLEKGATLTLATVKASLGKGLALQDVLFGAEFAKCIESGDCADKAASKKAAHGCEGSSCTPGEKAACEATGGKTCSAEKKAACGAKGKSCDSAKK
jgi:hypothetical protein